MRARGVQTMPGITSVSTVPDVSLGYHWSHPGLVPVTFCDHKNWYEKCWSFCLVLSAIRFSCVCFLVDRNCLRSNQKYEIGDLAQGVESQQHLNVYRCSSTPTRGLLDLTASSEASQLHSRKRGEPAGSGWFIVAENCMTSMKQGIGVSSQTPAYRQTHKNSKIGATYSGFGTSCMSSSQQDNKCIFPEAGGYAPNHPQTGGVLDCFPGGSVDVEMRPDLPDLRLPWVRAAGCGCGSPFFRPRTSQDIVRWNML